MRTEFFNQELKEDVISLEKSLWYGKNTEEGIIPLNLSVPIYLP